MLASRAWPPSTRESWRRSGRRAPFGTPVQDGAVYEAEPTHITYPGGTQEYFGYDSAGNLSWRQKADGTLAEIVRDKQHRVTQVSYPASGGKAAFTTTTTYDEFGRPISSMDLNGTTTTTYDALNRPMTVAPPSPQKALTYTYTPDTSLKRWITTVGLAGVGDTTYREDTKGRVLETVNTFGQTTRTDHDLEGRVRTLTHANGFKEEREYDSLRDWLWKVTYRKQNGTVHDTVTYAYDLSGHLRQELDAAGRLHEFWYDPLYRLTQESWVEPPPANVTHQLNFTYDLNGNRTSRVHAATGAATTTDNYGVDVRDKLLWVNRGTGAPTSGQANPYTLYTYDANGRTTKRERKDDASVTRIHDFFFDGDDRLREVKQGAASKLTAGYNGGGIRTNKWDAWSGQHDFSWGPGGVLYDSFQTTTYTPGVSQRKNGTDRFMHGDWLGSTRYMTDIGGNYMAQERILYDGFGNQAYRTGENTRPGDFQFAGRWGYQTEYAFGTEPGVGLQYLEQRYYDPVVGRFLTPDPGPFGSRSGGHHPRATTCEGCGDWIL